VGGGVPLGVGAGVPVCEPVSLRVPVALWLGVPVCEPVPLRVAVLLVLADAELHTTCAGSSCATLQKTPGTPLT
jgi:hypothetical protein